MLHSVTILSIYNSILSILPLSLLTCIDMSLYMLHNKLNSSNNDD